MASLLRRLYRLGLLSLLATGGILTELLVFPLVAPDARRRIIRQWSRALLYACGLQLQVTRADAGGRGPEGDGEAGQEGDAEAGREAGAEAGPKGNLKDGPDGDRPLDELARGRMLVSNHVSWLDIFAINALATSAFVAKAELRRWPVAGWLAALAGTVFIERSRRHAVHQVIRQLRQRIRDGFPVAVFPEATTSAGTAVLPFHGNLLEAAVAEGAQVIPLAIRYRDASGVRAVQAEYIGDTTFLGSLWSVLGARGLVVDVAVLPAVPAAGRNRHDLARELRSLITAGLDLPTADTGPGTAGAFQAASR